MRISLKHWLRRRRSPWLKIFYTSFKQFKKDKRQEKLLDYNGIESDSVVLDFGGFEGNWAYAMNERYGCSVHVFEPHPKFFNSLQERFKDNSKVHVHEYALGQESGVLRLSDDGDASSALQETDNSIEGKIIEAKRFFQEFSDIHFSVAKVNIEGGEYDLLPALLNDGFLSHIKTLQIQFHLYTEGDLKEREGLVARIGTTHNSDWSYPFVWEQWTRK